MGAVAVTMIVLSRGAPVKASLDAGLSNAAQQPSYGTRKRRPGDSVPLQHGRSASEVCAADFRIAQKLRTCAGHADPAGFNDVSAIRDLKSAHRVLLDQQNRGALGTNRLDRLKGG